MATLDQSCDFRAAPYGERCYWAARTGFTAPRLVQWRWPWSTPQPSHYLWVPYPWGGAGHPRNGADKRWRVVPPWVARGQGEAVLRVAAGVSRARRRPVPCAPCPVLSHTATASPAKYRFRGGVAWHREAARPAGYRGGVYDHRVLRRPVPATGTGQTTLPRRPYSAGLACSAPDTASVLHRLRRRPRDDQRTAYAVSTEIDTPPAVLRAMPLV
jgi:hypothetical protein